MATEETTTSIKDDATELEDGTSKDDTTKDYAGRGVIENDTGSTNTLGKAPTGYRGARGLRGHPRIPH